MSTHPKNNHLLSTTVKPLDVLLKLHNCMSTHPKDTHSLLVKELRSGSKTLDPTVRLLGVLLKLHYCMYTHPKDNHLLLVKELRSGSSTLDPTVQSQINEASPRWLRILGCNGERSALSITL